MDYVGSIFTLLGVFLGSSLTYFTNSKLKNNEINREELREDLKMRRKLYSQFLAEANMLALSALDEKQTDATTFNELSKFSVEIELVASEVVYEKAKCIMEHVIKLHQAEWEESGFNRTLSALRFEFVREVKQEFSELENVLT
ncbi:hypothetical protein [Vibrio crassostreae]|uniref:hypothetical protein n=1 Tax=Vibrio crassostreae TaxID=246167 RepID=UPI00406960B5